MVHKFFMPRILHISLMTQLMKLARLSLRCLAGAPNIKMSPWYRNLATVLAVWLGVTYANTCFVKWSWNTKMLATLGDLFSFKIVSMLVRDLEEQWLQWDVNEPSTSHPHVVSNVHRSWWIASSNWSFMGTKTVPAIGTVCSHGPDVLHPYCICSEWQLHAPLGLQRPEDPHSCLWPLSTSIGLSDKLLSSADSTRSVSPPHWKHALLIVSSDQSSFGLPTSLNSTQHWVFPLGFSPISNMHLY